MNFQKFYSMVSMALVSALLVFCWSCSGDTNLQKQEADFSVQAAHLYAAFEKNEAESNTKYVGKIVEVVGTVTGMNNLESEEMTLILNTNESGAVYCNFKKGQAPSFSEIKIGESIKIKGICSGFLMDVMLDNCIVAI